MNWIKQNTFLAGVLAILIIGALALGFLFVKARGQYAAAKERLVSAYDTKRGLENQAPFPNDDNADQVVKDVSLYRADAETLTNKMLAAQAEMPSGVRVARFQEDLSLKVDAVVGAAEASGVTLPEGFYLGLEKYRAQVPLDDAVDRLQFQLNATTRLAEMLLANEAAFIGIKRKPMPFESRQAARPANARNRPARGKAVEAEPVSEVYPMEVVLEMTQDGFQQTLNALSNTADALPSDDDEPEALDGESPGEYYFAIRWMRVENESPAAPDKSDLPDDGDDEDGFEDPEATDDFAAEEDELNMAFGREKIRAYLALDLVRFLKPTAAAE